MAHHMAEFLEAFVPYDNVDPPQNAALNAFLDTLIEGPAPPPPPLPETDEGVDRLIDNMPKMEKPKMEKPKMEKPKKRKMVQKPLIMPKQPKIEKPKNEDEKAEPVTNATPVTKAETITKAKTLPHITKAEMTIIDPNKPIEFDITDNCNGLPRNVVVNIYMCRDHK